MRPRCPWMFCWTRRRLEALFAVEEHAEAAGVLLLPLLGRHLVAGRVDPSHILDPELLVELPGQEPSPALIRLPVGGHHALVDAPGGFDLDVLVGCEQLLQPVLLLVGEQVRSGVQGPAMP